MSSYMNTSLKLIRMKLIGDKTGYYSQNTLNIKIVNCSHLIRFYITIVIIIKNAQI